MTQIHGFRTSLRKAPKNILDRYYTSVERIPSCKMQWLIPINTEFSY